MSTERGTAQPHFVLTKWGFEKPGPVGWSVLAGLAAELVQSRLGGVNVPGDSSLETSPQLSDDKMRFFTLNASGVPLQTGPTGKVMK